MSNKSTAENAAPVNGIYRRWLKLTLKDKLNLVSVLGFIIILTSVCLDIWTVKFSIFDFNRSYLSSEKIVNLIQALDAEYTALKDYTRDDLSMEGYLQTASDTDSAVSGLICDYGSLGEERFAWTSSIINLYSVYRRECDRFLTMSEGEDGYLEKEYELYEMLDYLNSYSSKLLSLTTIATSDFYRERFTRLVFFPVIIILLAIIFVSIIALLSKAVFKSLIDPLSKLSAASGKIANNEYNIPDIEVDSEDEIGELVHAFNKMKFATGRYIATMEDNRIALDKLHAEELQKIEIENRLERMKFEVLRHQINPHFLFNTLNVICGMAKLENAETSEKMIKALSSLFRYTLHTDEKESNVAQEIAVIKDYIFLQKMRFGDRIRYEIECDPETENAVIPSFTIQPLVENCIVHGLSSVEAGGTIRIVTHKMGGDEPGLRIIISDTGVGMSPEKLAEIREKLKSDDNPDHKGIGIGNISRRLSLMYPDASFEIDSTGNDGTVFTIDIPYIGG
ncbi:MAG: sensor histidine kinase [Lachnospiraceae bacterium]|nr:sensor histidine kinase [Lachnospiraceae bacterium]